MSEWSLFGIEPTSDKRAIKRAYAKLIKTIDPADEPKRFQQVREAYDYLLNFGRFYVEEKSQEQPENNEPTHSFDENQSIQNESVENYLEQSSEPEAHTEQVVLHEAVEGHDSCNNNQQDSASNPLDKLKEDSSTKQEHSNNSDKTDLVHSSVDVQSQEIATGFYQKTSYQSANEFIERLDQFFNSELTVQKSEWVNLIEDDEYQFFDVIELLRVDVFGFLVEQIEKYLEIGNQPEKLKNKLLKDRLPEDFDWLVKYLAEHFDWENTELILSSHFSGEQMKLLGQFYLKNSPAQSTETTKSGSSSKHYLFWVIFLIVLVKIFSAMDKGSGKNSTSQEQSKLPDILNSGNPSVFCSNYRSINSNKRAEECEQRLLPMDNKKRLILALYWLNQFDSAKRAVEPQQIIDNSLSKGVELLQQASASQYSPATNLLAWMKLGKHYQQQDTNLARSLLEQSSNNGDNTSTIALGIGYYVGIWGERDPEQASQILISVDIDDNRLSANLRYALAASYWLNVVKSKADLGRDEVEQQLKLIFLDNSETADLRFVNSLAWFFATADDESYDPLLALNLARQFQPEHRNSQEWHHLDTLAAAYAARGKFDAAIEWNDKSGKLLETQFLVKDDTDKQAAERVLAEHRLLFQQNKRVQVKSDNKAMRSLLSASFSELMRIDLQNLPE